MSLIMNVCVYSHIHMYESLNDSQLLSTYVHSCRHYFTYIILLQFHKNPQIYIPYFIPTFPIRK